jgi:hypothetical protein
VTALSREYTDGPTPPNKDEDGSDGTRSRRGGEDMNLGGGIQRSGHGRATTLTSRAKRNAGAAAILQRPQLLALELDGARAALVDLGRERDTLATDVILWQGRAVAAKAERDLLLSGGTGGRSTSCHQPNQRFTSNMLRDMTQGGVVSMTISNLTKEKMNPESLLAEERRRGLAAAATTTTVAADGAEVEEGSRLNHWRVIKELECRNRELVAKVESLRRAYEESKMTMKDLERTRKEEEAQRRAEDESRAANLVREHKGLLHWVEDLEGKLMSAEVTLQGQEVMQARKIKEYKGRLRAMAAKLEGERLSIAAMKRKLNVSAKARTSIFANIGALLEVCKTILAQRDKARDKLKMTRMQLKSKREEHVEQQSLIAAEQDKARDKLRMIRAQQKDKRRRRRSSSSGGGGNYNNDNDNRDSLKQRRHLTRRTLGKEVVTRLNEVMGRELLEMGIDQDAAAPITMDANAAVPVTAGCHLLRPGGMEDDEDTGNLSGAAGGDVFVASGSSSTSSGGSLALALGDGNTSGGAVTIKSGNGSTATGSYITILLGVGTATSLGSVAILMSSA